MTVGNCSVSPLLFIIIKTSITGPGLKNKVVYKLLAPWKTEENTTQGSNQRLTATLNPSSVPGSTLCREGHSKFEPEPAGNTSQIGTFYTLILQTPMHGLAAVAAQVYRTSVSAASSSG